MVARVLRTSHYATAPAAARVKPAKFCCRNWPRGVVERGHETLIDKHCDTSQRVAPDASTVTSRLSTLKNGFCPKCHQLVVQNPGTKFTDDVRNRHENKCFLQFVSETKIGVLSPPIVLAISWSKRSKPKQPISTTPKTDTGTRASLRNHRKITSSFDCSRTHGENSGEGTSKNRWLLLWARFGRQSHNRGPKGRNTIAQCKTKRASRVCSPHWVGDATKTTSPVRAEQSQFCPFRAL